MRIAMLTNNYKPFTGGVPISVERLAKGLRELGQEVYIFAPSYEDAVEEKYVIRYGSRKKKLNEEITIPKLFDRDIERKFSALNFDLIHVHHPVISGYTGCFLGRKYDIPVVFTHHTRYEQYLHYFKIFHGQSIKETDSKSEDSAGKKERMKTVTEKLVIQHNKIFTNRCDLIFAPTPGIKDFLQANGTIKEIEVLPTGLASKDFAFSKSEVRRIKERYASDGKRLFCSVSRLEHEKNISFLLEAIKVYKDRNGGNFRLLLIGEGSLKSDLLRKTMELGIQEQVVFTGCIPNDKLTAYYNACELFLFASTTETQGIVVLEAMAAGLPVIAVNASGVKDVVRQGINGYLTEEDIYKWAEKLEQISNNSTVYEHMKMEARKEALKYTSLDVAKTALRYYRNVVNRKEMERNYEKKAI